MKTLGVVLAGALASCSASPRPTAPMQAYELSLAVGPGGAWEAWHGGTGKGSAIFIRRLGRDNEPLSEPIQISDGRKLAYEPDLILANNELAVAWYEKDPQSHELTAWLAGVDHSGKVLWRAQVGAARTDARNPVVRAIGDELAVAWIAQEKGATQVWSQRFSLGGEATQPASMIGPANTDTWNLNAAARGNAFIVAYDAAIGTTAHELQVVTVTPFKATRIQATPDDGHASLYPDLQLNADGQAALTWFDEKDGNREVYLLIAPLKALGTNGSPGPVRVTRDKGESTGAYVIWNEQTAGLAWSDDSSGRHEIYAARFDRSGRKLGGTQRLSASKGQASVPTIRQAGSSFLIAWNDYVASANGTHGSISSSQAHIHRLAGRP